MSGYGRTEKERINWKWSILAFVSIKTRPLALGHDHNSAVNLVFKLKPSKTSTEVHEAAKG